MVPNATMSNAIPASSLFVAGVIAGKSQKNTSSILTVKKRNAFVMRVMAICVQGTINKGRQSRAVRACLPTRLNACANCYNAASRMS